MATNPSDIQLTEADKQRVATIADREGKPWTVVLQDALTTYGERSSEGEVDLEAEYRELFPDAEAAQNPVGLERMREYCPKSLALWRPIFLPTARSGSNGQLLSRFQCRHQTLSRGGGNGSS